MKKDNKRALYESIMNNVAKLVKKVLNESTGDGWNENELYNLKEVLSDIYSLNYEIESCYRGAYSDCTTYSELSDYIHNLANRLDEAADEIADMPGPFDEEDDENDDTNYPETDEEKRERDNEESYDPRENY